MSLRIGRPTTKASSAGDGNAAEQRQPGRDAEIGRADRDRIGADAEEAGVAEADLAGEAHQQVEAEHRERIDEDQRCDAIVEAGRQYEGSSRTISAIAMTSA